MNVVVKSQQAGGDPNPSGKPSVLWLASLWSCGAVILYVLASGLGDVVSLDAERATYDKRRTEDAAGLETLQQDVVRRRDESVELVKQAAALKSELQTIAAQKIKAVDQTTAAQADLKATNDEYQIELQRLRTVEAEHARLTADLATLKQRSEQATSATARLVEEHAALEQRKSKLTADIEGLTSKRDALLADLKTTNVSLAETETRLADERKKLLDKQKEVADATTALVPLTAEAKRIETLISGEAALNTQIASLTAKAASALKEVDDLVNKRTTLKTEVEKLQDDAIEVRRLVNDTRKIQDRKNVLEAEEAAASKRKASVELEAKTAEADARMATQLKSELPSLQTKKAELEVDLKAIQAMRDAAATEKATLDGATTALRGENDKQRAAQASLKVTLEAIEKEIERKSQALRAAGGGPAAAAKPDSSTAPEKPTASP